MKNGLVSREQEDHGSSSTEANMLMLISNTLDKYMNYAEIELQSTALSRQ
jgi:hypothetical protein